MSQTVTFFISLPQDRCQRIKVSPVVFVIFFLVRAKFDIFVLKMIISLFIFTCIIFFSVTIFKKSRTIEIVRDDARKYFHQHSIKRCSLKKNPAFQFPQSRVKNFKCEHSTHKKIGIIKQSVSPPNRPQIFNDNINLGGRLSQIMIE